MLLAERFETCTSIKTNTYKLLQHDGFYMDEVITHDESGTAIYFEYWLYHKDYGVKQHLLGVEEFIIPSDKHIELCIKNYETTVMKW